MTPTARKEHLAERARLAAKMDTWYNPTRVDQHLKLIIQGDTPTPMTIPPNGRAQIAAIHREAIHSKLNGNVVGGQAPMLINESEEKPSPVHQEHVSANKHLMLTKQEIEELETAPSPKKK